jgi:hypothetical protein
MLYLKKLLCLTIFSDIADNKHMSTEFVPPCNDIGGVLRHFNDLAVGETAAPACSSRENAEGAGMPPLLSL